MALIEIVPGIRELTKAVNRLTDFFESQADGGQQQEVDLATDRVSQVNTSLKSSIEKGE